MVSSLDKFIANSLTMMNLVLGSAAIFCITVDSFTWAALLILLASVMDVLDGKAARYFDSISEIGKNLDSLSDLVSFGIAPALLIFVQVSGGAYFWLVAIISLMYICCGAYRLARFNTMNISGYYMGIPITASGMLLAILSLLSITKFPILTIVITLVLAIVMVSKVKVPKLNI